MVLGREIRRRGEIALTAAVAVAVAGVVKRL
jgi:hypothetical protein